MTKLMVLWHVGVGDLRLNARSNLKVDVGRLDASPRLRLDWIAGRIELGTMQLGGKNEDEFGVARLDCVLD